MTAPTASSTPPRPQAQAQAHILVIPFPAQGHMIPLLDLTHKLATLNQTLTITILTTPKNQTLLTPLLSAHPSTIHPLILPFPNSHPSIPTCTENAKDPKLIVPIMLSFSNLKTPVLRWFNSHPSPPQSIISDMFCGWTQNLATELNIPRLVFSPSGAFALSTMFFLWKHLPKPQNTNDQNEVVSFSSVPNCPNYPWWQVSPLFRNYLSGNKDAEPFRDWFLANMASWGLVVNSFYDLEKHFLDHLRKELGHDRVWAVGPLLPEPEPEPGSNSALTSQRGGSSSVLVNDVVSWLDKRREREVVYLCFGSMVDLTEDQTVAIASALEKSGVHFMWSVKGEKEKEKDRDVDLLSGFEDRAAERGLVIRGWAPQVVILRHKAVGAFVTHCGWNSVLESVVAGVPMLAWPMSADQFVNATLLVEELKVAKKVCEGQGAVPDSEELARVLAESVSGSGSETSRALRLQNAAVEAIREVGSSAKDLRSFLDQIANLV